MKAAIHPEMIPCKVTCSCGNTIDILSTVESFSIDICSACHPFYTGQMKYVDSAGRVDKFAQRYALKTSDLQSMAQQKGPKKKKPQKLEHKINPKVRKVERPVDKKGEDAKAKKKS